MINLVIPAAGAATRLRPLSSNISKIMVRVNGKPTLDYILEQANKLTSSNISEVVIIDGKFNDIREYCYKKHPYVKFVNQAELKGPRYAIEYGIKALSNPHLPLVVWLGDAIILDDSLHLGTDFLLTKKVEDQSNWCMWDGNRFYDKPSNPINNAIALVGLYSFNNGLEAKKAFCNTNDSEISEALTYYSNNCNKFMSQETDKWYDIGQLSSYHKTSAALLNMKSRDFNKLEYDHELSTITKSSNHLYANTIKNESNWYHNLTEKQQCFVPKVYSKKGSSNIIMSYESGTLLSDLMLYEDITYSTWEYIIDKIFRIKLNYFSERSKNKQFNDQFSLYSDKMWIKKTADRLASIKGSLFLDATSTISKIESISKRIQSNVYPLETIHGDLHFGNILYNYQTDQFKLIDPRGEYGGLQTNSGDNIYDWAKLAHDLYHGYNAMVANVPKNEIVKNIFVQKLKQYNLPFDDIIDGGLILLASCIPLHYENENRQIRFMKYVENFIIEERK